MPHIIHLISNFLLLLLDSIQYRDKIIEDIINEKDNLISIFNLYTKYPQKNGYIKLEKAIYNSHKNNSHPPITIYFLPSLFNKT